MQYASEVLRRVTTVIHLMMKNGTGVPKSDTRSRLKKVWNFLRVSIWFSPVLMVLDLFTDALVIANYFEEGHTVWGSVYLAFIGGGLLIVVLIPMLVSFLVMAPFLIHMVVKAVNDGKFDSFPLLEIIKYFFLLLLWPIAVPLGLSTVLYYFDMKPLLYVLRKGCIAEEAVTPTIVLARQFHPTLTSTPQFVLQLSIALLTADNSDRVLVSMAVGGLSICSTTAVFTYKLSANIESHRWRAVVYRTLAVVLLEFSAIFCISSSIAIFERTAMYGAIPVCFIGFFCAAYFADAVCSKFGSQDESPLRSLVLLPSKDHWRHILTFAKVAFPAVFALSALPFTIASLCYDSSSLAIHNRVVHFIGGAGLILLVLSVFYSYAGYGKPFAFLVYYTSEKWPDEYFPYKDPPPDTPCSNDRGSKYVVSELGDSKEVPTAHV